MVCKSLFKSRSRDVARIFQRGVESHCVMAFSPPVVGCLLKKGERRGGGHGHPGPPVATPLLKHIIFNGDRILLIAHTLRIEILPFRTHCSSRNKNISPTTR